MVFCNLVILFFNALLPVPPYARNIISVSERIKLIFFDVSSENLFFDVDKTIIQVWYQT